MFCTACLRASSSPLVVRDRARSAIMSRHRCAFPTARIAWWMRPPESRVCAISNALTWLPEQPVGGHPHVAVTHQRVIHRLRRLAMYCSAPGHLDARRVARDQEHRHAADTVGLRVGHGDDDEERGLFASWR